MLSDSQLKTVYCCVYDTMQSLTWWRQLTAVICSQLFFYLLAFSSPAVVTLNHTSRDFVTWPAALDRTRRDFVVMTSRSRKRKRNFQTQMECSSVNGLQHWASHCRTHHSWDADFDRCVNDMTLTRHSLVNFDRLTWLKTLHVKYFTHSLVNWSTALEDRHWDLCECLWTSVTVVEWWLRLCFVINEMDRDVTVNCSSLFNSFENSANKHKNSLCRCLLRLVCWRWFI